MGFSACSQELATCNAQNACVALKSCVDLCPNKACATQCETTHAGGLTNYRAYMSCVVCDQCPIHCDAKGYGCN